MAFRASNIVPAKALEEAKSVAISAKRLAQTFSTMFQNTTNRDQVIRCWREFKIHKEGLTTLASVSGIAAYAKDQENDQTYDVVAEFTSLVATIDAVVTEIETVFPKDGSGFLAVSKFGSSVNLEMGTFPAASLSSLRTLLNTVASQVS